MTELYFKEIFEYPINEFRKHLENSINERIIFSGKYGIGKTKFLEDFFSYKNQDSVFGSVKYEVYRLFPINYSIASNEDIIRYIKYDIIVEMLNHQTIAFDEIKLELIDTLPEYAKKNLHKITAALVYMIPKLGKEVVDCFEKFDKLKEEFLEFHDKTNISSGDRLVEYLDSLELKEGSIYESDITTKIISESINKTDHQSVLLIDDIDRLDPEHVFRILNVFASHFDSIATSGYKNKFNFDKIVIVCDFNNIRNLFHHRYGTEVDFIGYIDKFYSSEVYHFDNKKAIIGIINKIFESVQPATRGDDINFVKQYYFRNNFLQDILALLINRRLISLRSIIKIHSKSFSYHYEPIDFNQRNSQINPWVAPICMQLKLLRDFFGDYHNMKKTLEITSLSKEIIDNFQWRFGDLLYVLSYPIHNFHLDKPFLFRFQNTPIVLEVKRAFSDDRFESVKLYSWANVMEDSIPVKGDLLDIKEEMFWTALVEVIELLHKKGYL
jgi:hypothetical protein